MASIDRVSEARQYMAEHSLPEELRQLIESLLPQEASESTEVSAAVRNPAFRLLHRHMQSGDASTERCLWAQLKRRWSLCRRVRALSAQDQDELLRCLTEILGHQSTD